MKSGQQQLPIRAFMVNLTVMTESVPGCLWILKGLEKIMERVQMHFKYSQIKILGTEERKGGGQVSVLHHRHSHYISKKPVKNLCNVFDSSLKDSSSIQSTCAKLDDWLKSVDKSGLPGKFKAWVYQDGILLRIL